MVTLLLTSFPSQPLNQFSSFFPCISIYQRWTVSNNIFTSFAFIFIFCCSLFYFTQHSTVFSFFLQNITSLLIIVLSTNLIANTRFPVDWCYSLTTGTMLYGSAAWKILTLSPVVFWVRKWSQPYRLLFYWITSLPILGFPWIDTTVSPLVPFCMVVQRERY